MSPSRLYALLRKEFIQMRRDRVTFAMMLGVPLIQLLLFGYAINNDPKHLPAALSRIFEFNAGTREFQASLVDQCIMDDHVRLGQSLCRKQRQETGIARPRAHQPDMAGHHRRQIGKGIETHGLALCFA